ncbi:MAG TPA: peptidylprolyl isomerase [Salinimicrobium sp.]|nr:peptidylprolyl isomerase [Salinimicrobium sp.]
MFRPFYIFCFALLIFASCEDKKTSKETQPDSASEIKKKDISEEKLPEKSLSEEMEEKRKEKRPEGPLIVQEEFIPFMTQYGKEHPADKIRIKTRFGNIDVKLFHDTPLHRANFIFLVNHNYFEDTYFYRVDPGFVIQAGNSDNASTNRKRHYIGDYLIPSEFEAGHKHVRGAFSAAKYRDQNVSKASAPYEFFIVQSKTGSPHLNNEHTVFGKVIDGMDVVDEINHVKTGEGEWPVHNIYIDVEILE